MTSILLMIITVVLAIGLIALGLFNYNSQFENNVERESYSFLNMFPYELQDKPKMKYSLFFRFVVVLFSISIIVFAFLEFFFLNIDGFKTIHDYLIGSLLSLLGITIIGIFHLDLTKYKFHLLSTSLLFTLTFILYVYVGLFTFIDPRSTYNEALGYILFIIAGCILLTLIFSPLKRWMYLEKKEENGQITYHRKHLSILPFMEWIFLGLDVLLIILIALF